MSENVDGSLKEHTFSHQMRGYAGLEGPVVIEKDTTFSLSICFCFSISLSFMFSLP